MPTTTVSTDKRRTTASSGGLGEYVLEENEAILRALSNQVSQLHGACKSLQQEVSEQTSILSGMDKLMLKSRGALQRSLHHINVVMHRHTNFHPMRTLIMFVAFVFFFLYYILRSQR